jgi:hypothetical protein
VFYFSKVKGSFYKATNRRGTGRLQSRLVPSESAANRHREASTALGAGRPARLGRGTNKVSGSGEGSTQTPDRWSSGQRRAGA